jgi:di/tricarboxylate transporter
MDEGRRSRVLRASLLDSFSSEALDGMFGEDAAQVSADLRQLGIDPLRPAPSVVYFLRRQLEQEVGSDRARVMALDVAEHLLEVERPEDALHVLSQYGHRSAFLSALGRAVRRLPSEERWLRWAESMTDEEAAADVELAFVRAGLHERRGDVARAAAVLRRAASTALGSAGGEAGQRLATEIARLAAVHGGVHGSSLVGRLSDAEGRVARRFRARGLRVLPELVLILALTIIGGAVGGRDPREAFALLLGAAILLWMTDLFPKFVVGLALIAAWVLSGVAEPADAVGGFSSTEWIFVVSVLGIAAAVTRSGLLYRVGVLLVRRLPQVLLTQASALLGTGVILSPLLPHAHGRAALVAPLALAVAQAQRLKDREPAAAVLGLAAWIGAGPLMFLFLNGSSLNLLLWSLMPEASRARFDWFHWFQAALPLGVFLAVGALVVLFVVLRPSGAAMASRERADVQLAVLGPPMLRELLMIVILFATMLGSIMAPALAIDVGIVAVLGLVAAAVSGNFDREALQGLDWDFLIFTGVALSVSHLLHELGLDEIIAHGAREQLGEVRGLLGEGAIRPVAFVLTVACLNLLIRLLLDQVEATFLLALTLLPVGPALGVDPWVVVITILATSSMWFLRDQTDAYVVALEASGRQLFGQQQARRVAVGYAAITLLGLALAVPYWHMLGLL